MTKKRSSGCCLWIFLGLFLGCVFFLGGVMFWLASPAGKALLATPAPINTCEGLLADIHKTSGANTNIQTDKRYILEVYKVSGDQLSEPEEKPVPDNLVPLQKDLKSQMLIWEYFVSIIPAEQRAPLNEFRIFSDGTGNTNGFNEISWTYSGSEETETWVLEIDLADYQDLKSINDVIVHELGHLLTLNLHQIDIRTKAENCKYFAQSDCSKEDSYINLFYEKFWKGELYDEWKTIKARSDPAAVAKGLDAFYTDHPGVFVRPYAATSLEEDIADSWTYFVMTPRPSGNTLTDQKSLFFYDFPEMVNLRTKIRSRICKYYNMPD